MRSTLTNGGRLLGARPPALASSPPAPRVSRASCRLSPTSPSSSAPPGASRAIAVAKACGLSANGICTTSRAGSGPSITTWCPPASTRSRSCPSSSRSSATAGLPSSSTCAGSQCLACPGSVTTAAASAPTSNRSRRRSADASIASRPIDAQLGAHLGSATRRSRSSVSSFSSGSAAASAARACAGAQRRRQDDGERRRLRADVHLVGDAAPAAQQQPDQRRDERHAHERQHQVQPRRREPQLQPLAALDGPVPRELDDLRPTTAARLARSAPSRSGRNTSSCSRACPRCARWSRRPSATPRWRSKSLHLRTAARCRPPRRPSC